MKTSKVLTTWLLSILVSSFISPIIVTSIGIINRTTMGFREKMDDYFYAVMAFIIVNTIIFLPLIISLLINTKLSLKRNYSLSKSLKIISKNYFIMSFVSLIFGNMIWFFVYINKPFFIHAIFTININLIFFVTIFFSFGYFRLKKERQTYKLDEFEEKENIMDQF